MPNPAKPVTRINRIAAVRGQTDVQVDAPLVFATEPLKAAFRAQLGASTVVAAPEAYNSPGLPGQIATDGDYLYVYTGDGETHQWPRVPLAHSWGT